MYYLVRYLIRLFQGRRAANAVQPADGGATEAAVASQPVPVRTSKHGPLAASRGGLALIVHQVGYDLRVSLRNPRARFFTFFFPILLLVVFNGVFGGGHTTVDGHRVSLSTFYVPGIMAMSIVVATYAGLVVSISTLRESGVLKRRRATPVPPALLIAGQSLSAVVITAWMSTILLVIAKVFYGVGFAPAALVAVAVTVIVGTITFSCIAYAVSGLIGSPEAAQPIVQATMFPLWFISGVFIPTSSLSPALRTIGEIFPVEHLSNSLHLASVNSTFTTSISATDMLALVAWALGAAAFAAMRFSWLPSTATA
jgi:ABC-2 type transport system permease protein